MTSGSISLSLDTSNIQLNKLGIILITLKWLRDLLIKYVTCKD